ncbi:hypothetical protein BDY19DRAFT_1053680 [Irpex rosettiformis]|uniref:Uncharacterized protein n=1 Tax=Irpex rosettiformis TaxID=378272 RepID=A0ACB8UFX5_9APHY|nr:hypothetical protein BDY19DRAFT_1053680 [Irpex rosettiformis]
MAPTAASACSSTLKGQWRPTKIMNMRDLSRDDDFLSHLLVEKLGTGDVPLVVHKMDPSRRLPKTNADELLRIVQRVSSAPNFIIKMVTTKGNQVNVIRQAVDDLLSPDTEVQPRLNAVKYYLKSSSYDQKQLNAFATHASRYFELYLPGGSIEISHTSRYAHRTGKSELCILATRPLAPGTVVTELKGSMADLTEEEDKELKRTDETHADGAAIRRDFSVIHSKQLKKNHLFLGPARFVNHDCDNNVELFREGRYITFRVVRPIAIGEEVTAHYGDGYFGRRNKHCLCATCEKNKRGGYAAADCSEDPSDTGSGSGEDAEAASHSEESDDEVVEDKAVNINERRTRRGVYTVISEVAQHLSAEDGDAASELSSLPPSSSPALPNGHGLLTPEPEIERGRSKGKSREAISSPVAPIPVKATASSSSSTVAFKSVISTRAQKAREASTSASTSRTPSQAPAASSTRRSVSAARQLVTPPLTVDSTTGSVRSSSRLKSREGGPEDISRVSTPMKDRKGKGRATASVSDVRDLEKDETETRNLRPRVAAPIFDQSLTRAKKILDAPRGLDGKPLPLCTTCGSVLPVISVNSEVVWGLSLGRTGKRGRPKKDQVQECPRCIRHSAIYGLKWPERLNGDGTRVLLPPIRDDSSTKKVNTSVSAPQRKFVPPVVQIPMKRPQQVINDEEEQTSHPSKKHKGPTGRPRGRPPKNKVGMSEAAKQLLNVDNAAVSRSGRTRVPSLKLRENEPPIRTRVSPRKAPPSSASLSSLSATSASSEVIRQTTPSPPEGSPTGSPQRIKVITPKSLAVAAQPRDANGRFGKKAETNGRFMRSRHFTVGSKRLCKGPKTSFLTKRTAEPYDDAERSDRSEDENEDDIQSYDDMSDFPSSDPIDGFEFGEEALEDVVNRRLSDSEHSDEQHGKRKRATSDDEDSDTSPNVSPNILGRARGSLLRPNPISYARRKWAVHEDDGPMSSSTTISNHFVPDAISDGDEDDSAHDDPFLPVPIIPASQDNGSDEEASAQEDSEESSTASPPPPSRPLVPAARLARLTFGPSPMNLAKRRWAPLNQPSHLSESAVNDPIDDPILRPASPVRRPTTISNSFRFKLAGTELDDGYPFSDADSVEESDDAASEEEQVKEEPPPPRLRPVSQPSSMPNVGRDRQTSPDIVVGDSCTDDSEQAVERILGLDYASRVPATRSPSPLPTVTRRNPDSPPGYEWKKTVLMPSPKSTFERPTIKHAVITKGDISVTVTTGTRSDLAGSSALPSVLIPQTRSAIPVTSSHSPSPLMTPPLIHQVVRTGWNAQSDSESL